MTAPTHLLVTPAVPHILREWVDPVALDLLADDMLTRLPGGQHLVPHLLDGPYHLFATEDSSLRLAEDLQLIWDAFVPVRVGIYPHLDATESRTLVDFFVLPHLVAQILTARSSRSAGYYMFADVVVDSFPAGPATPVAALQILVGPYVEFLATASVAGFAAAIAAVGLRTALSVLASLMPSAFDNDENGPPFEELLAATIAALT